MANEETPPEAEKDDGKVDGMIDLTEPVMQCAGEIADFFHKNVEHKIAPTAAFVTFVRGVGLELIRRTHARAHEEGFSDWAKEYLEELVRDLQALVNESDPTVRISLTFEPKEPTVPA